MIVKQREARKTRLRRWRADIAVRQLIRLWGADLSGAVQRWGERDRARYSSGWPSHRWGEAVQRRAYLLKEPCPTQPTTQHQVSSRKISGLEEEVEEKEKKKKHAPYGTCSGTMLYYCPEQTQLRAAL